MSSSATGTRPGAVLAPARRRLAGVLVGLAGAAAAFVPSAMAIAAPVAPDCDTPSWVVSWLMPQAALGPAFTDQTLRIVVPVSLGGSAVRVRLTNELGTDDIRLDDVHVGIAGRGASVEDGSTRVRFGGASAVTIPAGEYRLSDPVPLEVADDETIAVSVHVPGTGVRGPGHTSSQAQLFVAGGDRAGDRSGSSFEQTGTGSWFLGAVDVLTVNDGALVAFGDSITEGVSVREQAFGQFPTWPAVLEHRLRLDPAAPRLAVVNAGISGNRLLSDQNGPSALDRLERDALDHTGVGGVLLLEGINDLAPVLRGETEIPPLDAFVAGYRDLAWRAAARGIRLWISPLTPAGDQVRTSPFGSSATPEQVERRHEINDWIRHESRSADPRLDFDPVIHDDRFPDWIRLPYDSGDNLHPNRAGLRAMGSSIDPSLFAEVHCTPA